MGLTWPRRLLVAGLTLALAGCGGSRGGPGADGADGATGSGPAVEAEQSGDGAGEVAEPPDPADVGANELGRVPVLMYHGVVDEPATDWQVSPEEFRAELAFLREHDYHPVRAVDLARGEIDVPAGKSPVVLTFDDTLPSQFAYDADGEVEPDTAVGILLDFAEENPDFPAVGTFFVTDNLFKDPEHGREMLAHLHDLGFELGNHTVGHADLGGRGADEARRQLALGAQLVRETVPEAAVATLSLPLGRWPDDRELAYAGSHDGIPYHHDGVLLVGAHPAESPFHADFDPRAIPRIRAQRSWDGGQPDFMSEYWLQRLETEAVDKYVSDGDPGTVSFPEGLSDALDPAHADRTNPYPSP